MLKKRRNLKRINFAWFCSKTRVFQKHDPKLSPIFMLVMQDSSLSPKMICNKRNKYWFTSRKVTWLWTWPKTLVYIVLVNCGEISGPLKIYPVSYILGASGSSAPFSYFPNFWLWVSFPHLYYYYGSRSISTSGGGELKVLTKSILLFNPPSSSSVQVGYHSSKFNQAVLMSSSTFRAVYGRKFLSHDSFFLSNIYIVF